MAVVVAQGWGGGGKGEWFGHQVSFGDDENVLKLDCGNGYTTLWIS